MKYLVTGGAGFIGTNFVKYIIDVHGKDADICVLDALTYAGNLSSLHRELQLPNVYFVHADIGDKAAITEIMRDFDPDLVVNFAAESHVDRSIDDPGIFLRTNILGTQNLMDCCLAAWSCPEGGYRSGKRFLQVSTDEVYGSLERDLPDGRSFEIPEPLCHAAGGRTESVAYGSKFFTEDCPLQPRSPYSASKASADMLVLSYVHTYGFPALITRCSNNYGPYQFPEKLIPLVINNVLQGKPLPVYGDGRNVRDWLYVTDHCAAIDTVLLHGRLGEAYNIGGFNEKQNIDIVEMIIDQVADLCRSHEKYRSLLSNPQQLPDRSLIRFVSDRPGHDARYAIDPAKTAAELGWAPRIPFADGLPETVRWYLDNRSWVTDIVEGDYQKYYDKMYSNR